MKNSKVVEYQSIRSKASPEEIARAEKLYASINAGKPPGWMKRAPMVFRYKVILTFLLLQIVTLAIPVGMGGLSLTTALLSLLPGFVVMGGFLAREVRPLCNIFARTRAVFDNPIARHVFTGRQNEDGQVMLALKYLEKETGGIVGRIADSSLEISNYASKLSGSIELNVKNFSKSTYSIFACCFCGLVRLKALVCARSLSG